MAKKYNFGVAEANRRRIKHGGAVDFRLGKRNTLYRIWVGMKGRCLNPNDTRYARYGGRGITICAKWVNNFENFRADVGEKPKGKTLERINNNLGYYPNNVRWATPKEQANNRYTNVFITHEGMTMTLSQWATYKGWKYGLIASRWTKGLRGAELLAPRQHKEHNLTITYQGKSKTMREWSKSTGIKYQTLYYRYNKGMRGDRLFKKK
jgi:hypothetical protein